MGYIVIDNHRKIVDDILREFLCKGMNVCDCTLGNGNDTLKLSKIVGSEGAVYSFDIQEEAIESAENFLRENNAINNVTLIKDGHENLKNYFSKNSMNLFIYNLGWLPGGNKEITTRSRTTIPSIKSALELLKNNGLIIISAYLGHDEGMEEYKLILELLVDLDQKIYNVLKFEFINQKNYAPVVLCIEKNKMG